MRIVKRISLLFIYPMIMLGVGFYAGVQSTHFFYPEQYRENRSPAEQDGGQNQNMIELLEQEPLDVPTDYGIAGETEGDEDAKEVLANSETLCVDTDYVLKETNVLDHTEMEIVRRLPQKYVGMNREQFLAVMDIYETFPPLSEQQRGFVGLEVLSFSRERVVVRMNYKYIQPSAGFYLAAYDNKVWVYLEDKQTVYIETDIRVDLLPDELQQEIIQMKWVENQKELYNFLENYSS